MRSRLAPATDELVDLAGRWVRWVEAPPIDVQERTAWAPADPPAAVAIPGAAPIRSLKLKGVGFGDAQGAYPPTGRRYSDALARGGRTHVGIDDSGELCLRSSDDAPFGGIRLERAIAEFRVAERLVASGCPSIVPLAVWRYHGLTCEWDENGFLGAVLCGGPTDEPLRVAGVLAAEPDEDSPEGRACRVLLELFGPDRGVALANVAEQCGRTLREFHEAGLYRHNGFLTNYLVVPDARRVALVDLDSSLPLSGCTVVRQPLEVIRDVAGALFNLCVIALLPAVCTRAPAAMYERERVVQRFLEGYFSDLDDVPDAATQPFREHFASRQSEVVARRDEIQGSAEGEELLNHLWLDRPFSYGSLIAGIARPFERSALARRYPPVLDAGAVAERVEAFLNRGPRTRW